MHTVTGVVTLDAVAVVPPSFRLQIPQPVVRALDIRKGDIVNVAYTKLSIATGVTR